MDVQQKIVTAALAIVLIFVVNSAMAEGVYAVPKGDTGEVDHYENSQDITHGTEYPEDDGWTNNMDEPDHNDWW